MASTKALTPEERAKRYASQEKYKPEYCQMIIDFFNVPKSKLIQRTIIKDGKPKSYETVVPCELPTIEMFGVKIDVAAITLRQWADRYPEFGKAYITAKTLEKNFIVQNAMTGMYNPQFATFVAKNITDMRDQSQVQHGFDENALDQILSLLPDEYAEAVKKKFIEIHESKEKRPRKGSRVKSQEPDDE